MYTIEGYSSGSRSITDGGADMYDGGNMIQMGSYQVSYGDSCGSYSAGSQSYQMDIVRSGITVLFMENMVYGNAEIEGGLGKHTIFGTLSGFVDVSIGKAT